MSTIRRRDFIAGAAGAAAWPLTARAQRGTLPVIGVISPGDLGISQTAFFKGLRETGFIDGQNVFIEYRLNEGRNDPLTALPLVKDLVARRVSVIVAATVPMGIAAKAVTQTIPIVVRAGTDPVAAGLVASLNRPGANVTGISTFSQDLGPKRLELLREFLRVDATVAVLVSTTNIVAVAEARQVEAAAKILGLRLISLNTGGDLSEVEAALTSIANRGVGGLLIVNNPSFFIERERLAELAARAALPAIFGDRRFVEVGGLMSYGTDIPDGFRLTGAYVGRILKGEKPADLPVQLATKVELALNMRTAKALGLTFPLNLLGRADEVIE